MWTTVSQKLFDRIQSNQMCTSILVCTDVHYAKSGIDLVEPPSGRTFTLVVSCNSRYDHVICGRQFLIKYLAELDQIGYGTST